ncbi:MAG: redoxin domain-containing protein [Chloroflexi bacterium]|nr:redoxin domain-containing protein [Chloroflexota bacterium]
MDIALLVARLVLAAVFTVAGLAKLADLDGSRRAMRDFGVPAQLTTPLGTLLPLAELAVAIALVPRTTAWWGALGALVLLLAFVAGIGTSLARGRAPDCHCFGQLHSAPAGWSTLVRNGALAAVAALLLWQGRADPGPSVVGWVDDTSTAERIALGAALLALALVAVEGWALIHLVSQNGRLLLRLDALEEARGLHPQGAVGTAGPSSAGLPVGSSAPAFSLSGLHGETITLDALRVVGKPVMLIFTDPKCGPCNALLPEIERWQRQHADVMTLALVSRGTPEANRSKNTEHGLTHVLLQEDREVAKAYEAQGTPAAVLVRADGMIGSSLALGAEGIRSLVRSTTGAAAPTHTIPLRQVPSNDRVMNGNGGQTQPPVHAPAPAAQVGDPVPALRLSTLDGTEVELSAYTGEPTVVLFWNPGCGFCRRMLDDLKAWETRLSAEAPRLVVVSTGSVEANREMDLSSPVLLDQGFAAGRAFGARGTPSAVLIDASGTIASPVAVGAPAVLDLAGAVRGEAESGQS